MVKFLNFFTFIPFINRLVFRKYYATGLGTYFVNSLFKIFFGINKGDFLIHFTSRVHTVKKLKLEGINLSSVYLSFATSGSCYYQAINGITIGEGTIWSYNCSFISSNHDFKDLKIHIKSEPIVIGKNVWIGANCVILPSVKLGDNVIVGAGSVVTKNFESNSVIAGNPARLLFIRCNKCGDKMVNGICLSCE
jgi:hypothetical protein